MAASIKHFQRDEPAADLRVFVQQARPKVSKHLVRGHPVLSFMRSKLTLETNPDLLVPLAVLPSTHAGDLNEPPTLRSKILPQRPHLTFTREPGAASQASRLQSGQRI